MLVNFPKIVAMYRVKNEERWIEKSITSVLDICSSIVILDDGSTDSTLEICKSFDKIKVRHQSGLPLDESRDRNIILKMALDQNPDYIFTIDGDEILPPKSFDIFFEELCVLYPNKSVFEYQILYMWDKPNQIRYDGIYSKTWQKRLVNLKNQPSDLIFNETPYPGNLHCGGIPHNVLGQNDVMSSKVKFLHYGNFDQTIREKKYDFYNKIDPNDNMTDNYNHIISSNGKFSGERGLVIRTLPAGFFIENISNSSDVVKS